MSSVPNTNNNNPANTGITNSTDAQKRLDGNYSDFLKLLTTQLQNQDPTEPADTNQLTAQIAALSQVEQQINTNSLLEKLVGMLNVGQANNAVSYIGRQVDAQGNKTQLVGSQATLVYELPAEAKETKITISDSKGTVVFSGDGTKIAGRNQILWQGTNSITGKTVPDGAYTFTVKSKGMDGKDMDVKTYTSGLVLAVETVGGVTKLSLGDIKIPLDEVNAVYTAVRVQPEPEPEPEPEENAAA